MSQVEDKDKKIADLRSLLTQAKSKIEQYKSLLLQKQKETQQARKQFEKKTKVLEGDSENIIRQYEERLQRYQKTLQESNQLIDKHQKSAISASKSTQDINKRISAIFAIANKAFTGKQKESSEAVEELCQIEKWKEFSESVQRLGQGENDIISRLLQLLSRSSQAAISKRRQQRIQFVKRQTQMLKSVQEEKTKAKGLQSEIQALRKELSQVRTKHQKQIDNLTISKQKQQQQRTNEQFVKQLMLKLILGPKQASTMALGILGKVLKLSEDQLRLCQKKIR